MSGWATDGWSELLGEGEPRNVEVREVLQAVALEGGEEPVVGRVGEVQQPLRGLNSTTSARAGMWPVPSRHGPTLRRSPSCVASQGPPK